MKRFSLLIMIAILSGLLLGAGIAAAGAGGFSLIGWIAASLLCAICIFLLLFAWNWAGRLRSVLTIILLAFFLRLGLGVVFNIGLPVWGHDNDENKAGYLFFDPYRRDSEAWNLAKTDDSLASSFAQGFSYDQYGGLLTLSAAIYRYLTPDDVHRPILILILTAFAGSVGIAFLWKAFEKRWNAKIALIASLVVAFYPEAVLQGSTQSREPFLVGLICIAFWAVLGWNTARWKMLPAFVASLIGLVFISWPVAATAFGFLVIWFWLENYATAWKTRWKVLMWIGIAIVLLLILFAAWSWLHVVTTYEAAEVQRTSGWVQEIVRTLGERWRLPFLTIYGLTEPVLPATLVVYSQEPAWTGISIFRALGWYVLAPLLIFGFLRVWKLKPARERNPMLWLVFFLLLWLVISSLRAGGDMYDNPRYRVIFLPMLALCAGWAAHWAVGKKDPWLWRIIAVEAIFVVVLLNWYLKRTYYFGLPLTLYVSIGLCIFLGAFLVLGFWLLDHKRSRKNGRKEIH